MYRAPPYGTVRFSILDKGGGEVLGGVLERCEEAGVRICNGLVWLELFSLLGAVLGSLFGLPGIA